jgi:erythromycin esterase-like protein/predicted phosphoribosyltransferase
MLMRRFTNRRDAGMQLAEALRPHLQHQSPVILALPRGGIPIGVEIAKAFQAPFEVLLLKKVSIAGNEDTSMSAVASGGMGVIMHELKEGGGTPLDALQKAAQREKNVLPNLHVLYSDSKQLAPLLHRTIILVADGIATGASMQAAILAVRRPCDFYGVSQWYEDFFQVTNEEIMQCMHEAQQLRITIPAVSARSIAKIVSGSEEWVEGIKRRSTPSDQANFYSSMLDLIGDARFVLMGGSTHGTQEFLRERSALAKILIENKQFEAIAIDANWWVAYKMNRYVLLESEEDEMALTEDLPFPQWVWGNKMVTDFLVWLRQYNQTKPPEARVGIYSLDRYSLYGSIQTTLNFLEEVSPQAATHARLRYTAFDYFKEDILTPTAYSDVITSVALEKAAIARLVEEYRSIMWRIRQERGIAKKFYDAEEGGDVAKKAAHYYQIMFYNRVASWNIRAHRMAVTLKDLDDFLSHHRQKPAKILVWGPLSQIFDASVIERSKRGEFTMGQLLRQHYKDQLKIIGCTTYEGTVTAASVWGEAPKLMKLLPALAGSHAALLHQTQCPAFFVSLEAHKDATEFAVHCRLQRVIGAIYSPQAERQHHYRSHHCVAACMRRWNPQRAREGEGV